MTDETKKRTPVVDKEELGVVAAVMFLAFGLIALAAVLGMCIRVFLWSSGLGGA